MSNDLNPKVVKAARWFLFFAGVLWLLVGAAAWSTSAVLSVCLGILGGILILISLYGSNYIATALHAFNQKDP